MLICQKKLWVWVFFYFWEKMDEAWFIYSKYFELKSTNALIDCSAKDFTDFLYFFT